jgi:hypothetical protein
MNKTSKNEIDKYEREPNRGERGREGDIEQYG